MNLLMATEALHGWLTSKVTWSRFSFSSQGRPMRFVSGFEEAHGSFFKHRSWKTLSSNLEKTSCKIHSKMAVCRDIKPFKTINMEQKISETIRFTSNQPKITQGSQALREFAVAFEKFPRNFSLLSSLPPHEKRRDRERGREGTNKNKNNTHDEPKYV